MKKKLKRKNMELILVMLIVTVIFSTYQFLLRPILKKSMATEVIGISITFVLAASLIITFLLILILSIYIIILKSNNKKNLRMFRCYRKSFTTILLIVLMVLGIYTYYSQKNTYVKPMCNEYNDIIPTSISSLEKVELNGNKQWVSYRGKDKSNPVLLVLSDGPGKSQMSEFNKLLEALQEDFVLVNWDELGSGKSNKFKDDYTIENYVSDGVELSRYLCKKFNQDKIYVLGNSFGSTLGILMLKEAPDLYESFIGTSSIVSVKRNEEYRYNKALEIAESINDEEELRKLKAQGGPPYDKKMYNKQKVYYDYLKVKELEDNKIQGEGENKRGRILSSEYGLLDKIHVISSQKNTYDRIFKSYYDIDLIDTVKDVKVPVYFIQGSRDYLASSELLNEYFSILNAPDKQILWLEKSGSMPWISENKEFITNINKRFLNK